MAILEVSRSQSRHQEGESCALGGPRAEGNRCRTARVRTALPRSRNDDQTGRMATACAYGGTERPKPDRAEEHGPIPRKPRGPGDRRMTSPAGEVRAGSPRGPADPCERTAGVAADLSADDASQADVRAVPGCPKATPAGDRRVGPPPLRNPPDARRQLSDGQEW